MRARLKTGFVTALLFLVIIIASFRYYSFVEQTIYSESVSHLTEIFHQSNHALKSFVEKVWGGLHMWANYLKDVSDETAIMDFVNRAKEEEQFTDFYFVSREGNYLTITGDTGYLNLGGSLTELIYEGQDTAVNSVVPGKPQIIVFLTSVCGSYQGFSYHAIAVSYSNQDMVNVLQISSFDGASDSYMIHADGRVILNHSTGEETEVYNLLAMLAKNSDLSMEEIGRLRKNLKQGKSGDATLRLGKERYYLIYEPSGFKDWILAGFVPTAVVNASMSKLQLSSVILTLSIMGFLGFMIISAIVRQNRKNLRKKDMQIIYRDELFSKLSIHVDDVFLMLDAKKLSVDYISPNIERLFGITEKQARGNIHILDTLSVQKEATPVTELFLGMLPGQQKDWDRAFLHQKTKEERWFCVIALCSMIQNEKKYILVMSDRTRDKMINQALKDALNAAESANSAKNIFLSNISHDIRTPMNAIIGFTTLAGANVGNEVKIRDYLEKILSAGNHLLSLINSVLDMSRLESGKMHLEETETNLSEVLSDLNNLVSGQIQIKQLELYVDTTDVADVNVFCDRVRLNQVLLNLLSNAVKFTEPGGTIWVSISQLPASSKGKGHYEIHVRDTGIGMSKEFAERIFVPFERERSSTVSRIQGTGLGMSIAKNIIDMMGGEIEVITEKGKGTEFIIDLEFALVTEDG